MSGVDKQESQCVGVMRKFVKILAVITLASFSVLRPVAQDLAPRAYVITPKHSNAIVLTYSLFHGEIIFDGTVPISNANGTVSAPIFTYYHALSFFGRSANVAVTLPYAVGNLTGDVNNSRINAYRSGLMDTVYRFSVNLKGGPAMTVKDFRSWQQKTIIGVSLKFSAPTGQYDPSRLINTGGNRWVFKPEIGLSRRWGHWIVDAYGGAYLFTRNHDFFSRNQYNPNTNTQTQQPIASFEGHLSYDVRPRLWVSLDGNFWRGGMTSMNDVENGASLQSNSRIGGTASIPVNKRQSVKLSYSRGARVRFGGNFQNVSVGWQYSWIGKPQ